MSEELAALDRIATWNHRRRVLPVGGIRVLKRARIAFFKVGSVKCYSMYFILIVDFIVY
ncbi:hypothetical protein [Pectobacterium versatile]|uniref:hypothetical protein n=1 Tax=Pectobacterium versatile TaxID=2488639 RepID=UPI003820A496